MEDDLSKKNLQAEEQAELQDWNERTILDDATIDLEDQQMLKEQKFAKILKWVLIAVIPMLIVVFVVREVVHKSGSMPEVSSKNVARNEESWRLDTNKNYTMDVDYWMNEPANQERHYYFNISTMVGHNADGIERNLTVVNGQYPAPLIEANAGDTLFIHVINQMPTTPVTIHCHGLFFNKNNSFQDGASSINQCPIPPKKAYVYEIELDDEQYGTYWYHSHYGSQYADGLFGPLVIHSPKEMEQIDTKYDKDIVVMVNDFYHDVSTNYLPEYLGPDNENTEPTPDDGLIQGVNKFDYVASTYLVPNGGSSDDVNYTPVNMTVMDLDPNSTYRLRLVNSGFFLPFDFQIDNHSLEMIEADGTLVKPLSLDSISVSVAQRYSFILKPSDDKDKLTNYWMHAAFNQFCEKQTNSNFNHITKALISYTGAADASDVTVEDSTWNYNGGEVHCRDFDQSQIKTLGATVPMNSNGSKLPDVKIDLDVSFFIGAYQKTRGYFNDQTYIAYPNTSTMYELAMNPHKNSIKTLQNKDLMTKNENQFLINLNQRGQIVDFVINNYDDGAHPFHFHGHKFWVLKIGDTGYFNNNLYDDSSNEMNFDDAVLRDTFNIPGFGWAVIRFVVDTPGVWPFHCHIGWHMESGLLLQVNALQDEYSSWKNYPKQWKDQCKYWKTHSM